MMTGMLGEVWLRRYALQNLVLKDLRAHYRNMSLGLLWCLANPLVMMTVLAFVNRFIAPDIRHPHLLVHMLCGLVVYNLFALSMSMGTASLVDNAPLLKRIPFPRILLPLGTVLAQGIHVGLQFLLIPVFMLFGGAPFTWAALWAIPAAAVALVFVTGTVCLASALNVYYRDVRYVVESGSTIAFWLSPVLYAVPTVQAVLPKPLYIAFLLNPLAGVIDTLRRALTEGLPPDPLRLGIAAASALAVFALGTTVFRRLTADCVDHL